MNLSFDKSFLKKIAYSFGRAFVAVFVAGLSGIWAFPDWNTQKAALVALTGAALTAGVRAIQHVVFDPPA